MTIFKVYDPYSKVDKKWNPIPSDPSTKYEVYLYSKKMDVTFRDVMRIYLYSFSRVDYYGVMSLIYSKYYREFYYFLLDVSKNESMRKKYRSRNLKFYRNYLERWSEFVKYSDDTAYPQNEYIKKMSTLLIDMYELDA